MVQVALAKLNSLWQGAGWPLRAAAIVFAVVAVGYGVFSIAETIHSKRYEKKLQAIEQRAMDAEKKANEQMAFAEEAHARAEVLELRLKETNQQLLGLNAQLQEASQQTARARTIYAEKKTQPKVVWLTGDASVDSRELCARLSAAGYPCK